MKRLYIYDRNGDIVGTGSTNSPPKANRRWFISDQPPSYFSDKKVVNGEVVSKSSDELQVIAQEQFLERKAELKRLINQEIQLARKKFITDLPGQDAIYARKKETAVAYLQMDPPPTTLDDFPLLQKEVGITAPTAFELAQIWMNLDVLWETVAANLEAVRLGANQTVDQAATMEELNPIEEQLYSDIRTAVST